MLNYSMYKGYNEHSTINTEENMNKFTSIGQFRSVVKTVANRFNRIESPHLIPTLTFTGTVKLHGTNAGVRRYHGKIQPQSKEQLISVGSDNYGFAAFIAGIPTQTINSLFDKVWSDPDADVTLYGEWTGQGIQDTVAVSQVPKHWVLFKALVNGIYVDFRQLSHVFDHDSQIYNIYEIEPFTVDINFKRPELCIPTIEQLTLDVEKECPWTKQMFGISGIGEGIVWTSDERPDDSELFFKTKGDKHSKSKVKKVATVDIERVTSINNLVDLILTNGRLEQGIDVLVNQQKLSIDPTNMGAYMKWIANDIIKEETDTIVGNGFVWTDVVKVINTRAREFFFAKMNDFS